MPASLSRRSAATPRPAQEEVLEWMAASGVQPTIAEVQAWLGTGRSSAHTVVSALSEHGSVHRFVACDGNRRVIRMCLAYESPRHQAVPPTRDAILLALTGSDGMTNREIADVIGSDGPAVRSVVMRLLRDGCVRAVGSQSPRQRWVRVGGGPPMLSEVQDDLLDWLMTHDEEVTTEACAAFLGGDRRLAHDSLCMLVGCGRVVCSPGVDGEPATWSVVWPDHLRLVVTGGVPHVADCTERALRRVYARGGVGAALGEPPRHDGVHVWRGDCSEEHGRWHPAPARA